MNSKIIKSFFTGDLADENIHMPKTQEYKKLDEQEYALYKQLRPTLTAEQTKLFDDFVDTYSERNALIEENYYIRGFKFGLRLAAECFDFSDLTDNVDEQ